MDEQTKLFREKAESYLVCFNNECAKAGQCLRRLLADFVPETRPIIESVNPTYVSQQPKGCNYFRSAEPIRMYKGLTGFYNQIPEPVARSIRFTLLRHYGNSTYYRLRKGERLITPSDVRYIESVCRKCGWTGALSFDAETTEFDW